MENKEVFDKSEILRILKALKTAYLNKVSDGKYMGFCIIMKWEFPLNYKVFKKYLKSTLDSNHTYYDHGGTVTKEDSMFAWKVKDLNSRIFWLLKHIKLNS